jgi:hypothetical protein
MSKGYSGNLGKEGKAVIANCLFENLCFFSERCNFPAKNLHFCEIRKVEKKRKKGGKIKKKKAGAGYKQ